jgi:hypothetical protein
MKQASESVDRVRKLEEEHRSLDLELQLLVRRAYLTPDEQRRATELKRLKLVAKDRLYALSR